MKFVYVLSHAFSGSTLMAFLLGAHPRVATIGEITVTHGIDIETYSCSCGEIIHRCPFWTGITSRMQASGLKYDVFDPRLRFRGRTWLADRVIRAGVRGRVLEAARSVALHAIPGVRREAGELLRRNEVFVQHVVEQRGRDVFLDISKHPNRLRHLARSKRFDIHVVYLVRDPRAVAFSCRKNLGMALSEGARSWASFARECDNVRRYFPPERWTVLWHEDLCRDPDAAMDRIHAFAGIEPDRSYRDFRSAEHHIIGNRMRMSGSSEIRQDRRWEAEMSDAEQAEVAAITAAARRLVDGV